MNNGLILLTHLLALTFLEGSKSKKYSFSTQVKIEQQKFPHHEKPARYTPSQRHRHTTQRYPRGKRN